MARVQLSELTAFVAVAERLSLTKAARELGMALPTISQTVRSLEEDLGVRLFNRTTRSVALTEAGERLLAEVLPVLEGVGQALESINLFREKPIGTLRLTVVRPFGLRQLAPLIRSFSAEYPDIRLEIALDDANVDIVKHRFDAGIRVGSGVGRDMKIVRMLDDFAMLTVASPNYLSRHPEPLSPGDLRRHNCLKYRSPGENSIHQWTLSDGRQKMDVPVEGSLVVNDLDLLVEAALNGVGIAYLPRPIVETHLAAGRLVHVLPGWEYMMPGIFLFHPSRRQVPVPLQVFVKFIQKWRKTLSVGVHQSP